MEQLFTITVMALLHAQHSGTHHVIMEDLLDRLERAGFLDPAVTIGDGIVSFTAQLPASSALIGAMTAVAVLGGIGRVTNIEVEPCLQAEQALMAV